MKQLVQPNLNAVGKAYYCYGYADSVFSAPDLPPYYAWGAWEQTQFKHYDQPPTDVAVPVWYSWSGTVDDEYKNWGHVAVWVPGKGVYTSPLSGTGHLVYNSPQELADAWGLVYVGWSEDLSGVKIVEEDFMITDINSLKYLYLGVYAQDIPNEQLANDPFIGKDFGWVTTQVLDYANRNNFAYWQYKPKTEKQITDLQKQLTDCQNKPPVAIPVDEQAVVQNWLIRLWNNLFKRS